MIARALLGLCLTVMIGCFYMLVRNAWVYRWRTKAIDFAYNRPTSEWFAMGMPGPDAFIASYNQMMRRFWVWDAAKFAKRPQDWPL